MSVAQADEVIIALPGDKSKMSIYEKNPSGEGFDLVITESKNPPTGGLGIVCL